MLVACNLLYIHALRRIMRKKKQEILDDQVELFTDLCYFKRTIIPGPMTFPIYYFWEFSIHQKNYSDLSKVCLEQILITSTIEKTC